MFNYSDVEYLNSSNFNRILLIFDMGYGLHLNCLFKFQYVLNNSRGFVFDFGLAKDGDHHLESFASSNSSTWHFQITIFVALNSGNKKSTFTFFEVINFPDWVYHKFYYVSYSLRFDSSIPITTVEMLLLSNII